MRLVLCLIAALSMILRPEDVPQAYAPWAPLRIADEPNPVTTLKVLRTERDAEMCRGVLVGGGITAASLPDFVHSPQCHIRQAVRPSQLTRARLRPERMRCGIALRLALWERHDLQPAAREILGAEVAEILHAGAYSCRTIRTTRGASERMSEHATANAFDITGFVLSDGRRVILRRDWQGSGAQARFLRAARDGLCSWFRVVLGPEYNALHADHFHVDQGPFLTCR
ncbi:MAG: extensin family protein [Pseudomonadota bacterium]